MEVVFIPAVVSDDNSVDSRVKSNDCDVDNSSSSNSNDGCAI